jgi:hypothetical protein
MENKNDSDQTRTEPAPTGAATSETPANPQSRKKRRVTVDTSSVAESPPEVLPGQLAVPTTGVPDVPKTAPYKRGPGRPRGSFGGKPSTGFPPVTSRQIRADERRHAEEKAAIASSEFSSLDWINVRYMAENLLTACQRKDTFETKRILGIIAGVSRHLGFGHA